MAKKITKMGDTGDNSLKIKSTQESIVEETQKKGENIKDTLVIPANEKNKEQKEVLGELDIIPIFRNNDLYSEIFSEIKPTFEKGEEPTLKKLLNTIIQYPNKRLILDSTCKNVIYYPEIDDNNLTLDDIPKEFSFKEIPLHPKNNKRLDASKIFELLKERFNIDFVKNESNANYFFTIEEVIDPLVGGTFSPELVKILFDIAKQKNKNIKKVYILTENIQDHIHGADRDAILPTVIPTLVTEAKKSFGLDPIVLPTMNESDIQEGDLVIVDRHNTLVRGDIAAEKPIQITLLPIESELMNNTRLENKPEKGKLISLLRKKFVKKSDKDE